MSQQNSNISKNNKNVIKVDNFTFNNPNEVESIVLAKNKKEFENEWLSSNNNDKVFKKIIEQKLFKHLSIGDKYIKSEDEKQKALIFIKSINSNYFSVENRKNLWMLSELCIPIYIAEGHKNLEWIWFNQYYNVDTKLDKPANGLDFAFIHKDKTYDIIYGEVKSSYNSNYKQNINRALDKKGFLNFYYNDDKKLLIKKKIERYLPEWTSNQSLNWDSEKFILGGLYYHNSFIGLESVFKSINIDSSFQKPILSLFECYISDETE